MPAVSVIIPAFNGDRFICEAIESVFNQTYRDFEIIVVDDGSSDRTQQELAPYTNRIQLVYQTNQGVAAARNRGLQLAQGEFIAFLDQDDLFLPDKLALQMACFEANPCVGIVHSGWKLVDHQRNFLGVVEPWHEAPSLDAVEWLRRMPVLLSAMLFRREWLDHVNGFCPQFRQVSDVKLMHSILLLGCQSAWVRQITTEYRQHDRNDSLNTRLQAKEVLAVQAEFFNRPDLPDSLRQIESECRYHTLIWIAWRFYLTGYRSEMVEYLERSLALSHFHRTETVLNWVDRFRLYAVQHGSDFDVRDLTGLPEWQQLTEQIVCR